MQAFIVICVLVTLIKLSLMNFYHSTDFEVHRNWLAITHSLPISQWYTDTTSQWTLDYPPAFAYFEWTLSQLAGHFDPAILRVSNLEYASASTVLFQRLSVCTTDAVLMLATYRFHQAWLRNAAGSGQKKTAAESLVLIATAIVGNVGLLLVDHIHFQYNGVLFGVLLLSIASIWEQRYVRASLLFALLLCAKHIFLYMAPVFGVYLLRAYVFADAAGRRNPLLTSAVRLAKLAAAVLAVTVTCFAPFAGQLPQLAARLFPFKRGLTHAYWAPNVWAVYNGVDKALAVALRVPGVTNSAAGRVEHIEHAVLPSVAPWLTFALSGAAMAPCLWRLACSRWDRTETPRDFIRALVLCAGASFLFGWHVHEKAILMLVLPLSLLCAVDRHEARYTQFLSLVAHYSLFPLLDTEAASAGLTPLKFVMWLLHAVLLSHLVRRVHGHQAKRTLFEWLELVYRWGFVALFVYTSMGHSWLRLDGRFPFVPLMLCSTYCAAGVIYFWLSYYWRFMTVAGGVKVVGRRKKVR